MAHRSVCSWPGASGVVVALHIWNIWVAAASMERWAPEHC